MRRHLLAHYREEGLAETARDTLRSITLRLSGRSPRRWYEDTCWLVAKLTSRGGIPHKKILGQRMYLNPNDTGISKELAVYKIHEPLVTEWLQSYIKSGMVVIDIGANTFETAASLGANAILSTEFDTIFEGASVVERASISGTVSFRSVDGADALRSSAVAPLRITGENPRRSRKMIQSPCRPSHMATFLPSAYVRGW